jgi:hypothetical protein
LKRCRDLTQFENAAERIGHYVTRCDDGADNMQSA